MKRSIFLKIAGGYAAVILILVFLILIFSFRTLKDFYIETSANNLKNLGLVLSPEVSRLLNNGRTNELDGLAKSVGPKINIRITVIDPDGRVLADSEKSPETMENHSTRPEIFDAMRGKIGESIRFSTTVEQDMLYIAIPLTDENAGTAGVLRLSLFLKDINSLITNLKTKVLQIAFIITAFFMLMALLLSRTLSKPIRDLASAARNVAQGNFGMKIFTKNRDELKELADSFNYMTTQIKKYFEELSRQKEEVDTIISSIQEGLLLLDSQGKIIFCNDSIKGLLKVGNLTEKPYWQIIRIPELNELIKSVRAEKKNFTNKIEFDEKTFLCSATFLNPGERIVIVFNNITGIKHLERIKKDLVINVSHELKTPLTAIKGFIETLEGENLGSNSRHYVDTIKTHVDRLINIVQDLLAISELEDRGARLELVNVNLKSLLENTLKIFDQKVNEKGLRVTLIAENNLPEIKGDSYRLEQMLINLIDNAIKYSEKGEIRISLQHHGKGVEIEIRDTGIGIPREHIPLIFERFYVVDKSRSRKLGGTGLGLSIVKHIVLLHNGEINVESAPGVGTKFTITLPLNP
ncbi:MAG TPA: ATP-binding protein [bacterium]